jgi:hypothetical protein
MKRKKVVIQDWPCCETVELPPCPYDIEKRRQARVETLGYVPDTRSINEMGPFEEDALMGWPEPRRED